MSKRGSLWNKWDLHIHSPKTFLANNYQNCSVEDYVQAIVDSGVKAVGLTNYFRFHDDELDSIKQQLNDKGVVVFPNLEFRTQPPNKENDEMHIHLLFSDKTPTAKITGFLGRLETTDGHYCSNLTEQQIQTTSITLQTLKKKLDEDTEIKQYEDFLLIACPCGQGNFRPSKDDDGRGNAYAIVVDKNTDVLFGNTGDIEYFLDTSRYIGAESKPVVHCSDAHEMAKIGSGYTWIKADLNFEGLKQILWEPRNRVRIQDLNPGDSKSGRIVIDKITYRDSAGVDKKVLFNKDLNSIIGIRGSGKSTLLKNIAIKVEPQQFIDRGDDPDRMYHLNTFKVVWGDGQEDAGTSDSPKSLFYIPQNYLSMLAYDELGRKDARDEFLTSLLKKNVKFANALRTYSDFVSDNKVKIERLIEDLLKANHLLGEAQQQIKKQGSRKEIEAEITVKREEIKNYQGAGNQALTEDEIKEYTEARQIIQDNTQAILVLEQDKDILEGLRTSDTNVVSIASQEITRLSSIRQQTIRNELMKKSKESLNQLITTEVGKITLEITTLTKSIKDKQTVLRSLSDKVKANKALSTLTKELGQLQQTLKAIGELEVSISTNSSNREAAITGLVDAYADYDSQQASIFGTIEFEEDFQFLKIDIVTYYNISSLSKFVEANINTVKTSPKINADDQDLKKMFFETPTKPTSETIRKLITKLVDGYIVMKVDATEVSRVLSDLLRDRFEINYLNSVKTKDGVLFRDMTGGQKAIAMLELVFSFDDERYPILIDQPEDDLDVSGVANDLVNFIKLHKENRQIIIVSHNGSLVVCSDSEEVLVSNCTKLTQDSYDFIYKTGSIESRTIREDIIQVLEGGKEALRQRARKLNFKHEI